jgi:F-type H+-transporting ATPase subunit b
LKFHLKILFALALIGASLSCIPHTFAQDSGAQAPAAQNSGATADEQKADAEKEASEAKTQAFRHSPQVRSVAHMLKLEDEPAAKIFEDINSAILIFVILWFLFRMMPKVLRKRTETLQKQLLEARLAATEANERLTVVEERLSKLGIEIDAIRQQTERDSVEDEKRIQESLEHERQRIVASAEQEIEAAGAAAQRELKSFAANLAIERALHGIHLTPEDDRVLIHKFGEDLKGRQN